MPITTLAQAEAHVRGKNRPGQIDGILLAEIDRLRANEAVWMERIAMLIARVRCIPGVGADVTADITPPQRQMDVASATNAMLARHRAAIGR